MTIALFFPGLLALGRFDHVQHSTPDRGQATLIFESGATLILPTAMLEGIWPPKELPAELFGLPGDPEWECAQAREDWINGIR